MNGGWGGVIGSDWCRVDVTVIDRGWVMIRKKSGFGALWGVIEHGGMGGDVFFMTGYAQVMHNGEYSEVG